MNAPEMPSGSHNDKSVPIGHEAIQHICKASLYKV